jgi:hypothetical protein
MLGCVTQTADGTPLVGVVEKAGSRTVEPTDPRWTQVTDNDQAMMRAHRHHDDDDDEDQYEDANDQPDDDVGDATKADFTSPGHHLLEGGPLPRSLGGKHSTRSDFGVTREHIDLHDVKPAHLVDLSTVGPYFSGSSFNEAPGHVTVQTLDQQAASVCGPVPGSPGHSPKQPDYAPAPSGHGQRFGRTPPGVAGSADCAVPSGGRVGG